MSILNLRMPMQSAEVSSQSGTAPGLRENSSVLDNIV